MLARRSGRSYTSAVAPWPRPRRRSRRRWQWLPPVRTCARGANDWRRSWRARSRLVAAGGSRITQALRSSGALRLVLLVGQPDDTREEKQHVVNRPAAPAFPIARIRDTRIVSRVVVPRRHLQDRALGQQRRDVIGVVVHLDPVVVVSGTTERLLKARRVKCFQAHPAAARMQVGL